MNFFKCLAKNFYWYKSLKTCKRLLSTDLINAKCYVTYKDNKNRYYETLFEENCVQISLTLSENNKSKINKKFPYIWLRDKCKCSECYNYTADEVEVDLGKISDQIKPVRVEERLNQDSKVFTITWSDGHKSEFDLIKLSQYALEHSINNQSSKFLWNKDILNKQNGLVKLDYRKYLSDDSVLAESLKAIKKYGAVLLEGVPVNEKELSNVCRRIGPIQNSHFGADCLVTNNLLFKDRAYTNLGLKCHTDTAYFKNSAGIEMFHVMKPADKGGESVLVDGFYCVEELKKNFKEDYDTLTRVKVESQFFKQGHYDFKFTDTVIKLDPFTNQTYQIRFNPYNRVNTNHLCYEEIEKYYKAIRNFAKIVQNPSNEYWIALREDQVLLFDNFRLLHGRASFEGTRTLVTVYLSRDDWLSKASVLKA